jgi:hypothetical protein
MTYGKHLFYQCKHRFFLVVKKLLSNELFRIWKLPLRKVYLQIAKVQIKI